MRSTTMSVREHMRALRRRFTRSMLAFLLASVAGWFLSAPIWTVLGAPIVDAAGTQHRTAALNFSTVTGAFDTRMQIALFAGLLISSPVWLYQTMAFVFPGLQRRERAATLLFVTISLPLFLAGCAAGLMVLPHMVAVLSSFAAPGTTSYVDAHGYLTFVLKLSAATGLAFVLPVGLVVLNRWGIVSGRALFRSWRFSALGICVFTAIVTPAADLLSMVLLAVPMVALYLAAGLLGMLHDHRRERRQAKALVGEGQDADARILL